MANSNPVKCEGVWKEGFALDVHTLASDYLGDDEFGRPTFRTTRTELGELLYRLKYQRDASAVDGIVEAASAFVRSWSSPGIRTRRSSYPCPRRGRPDLTSR